VIKLLIKINFCLRVVEKDNLLIFG